MRRWKEMALFCEREYGIQVELEEGFFICPECGEPLYECDWHEHMWDFCPICEFNFLEGDE